MKKVLITKELQPIARELLAEKFEVSVETNEDLSDAVQKYDGILSTLDDRFDHRVLSSATQTKFISNMAMGLDNIDVQVANEKGIGVFNLNDVVTQSTADLTFALFLAFIRKIPEGQAFVRQGQWGAWEPNLLLGEELNGKTFGIIGMGRIGKAVARRAEGFGMKVISVDPRKDPMDEFLSQVDYLSLHTPLTKQTLGLINLEMMKKMMRRPILINMSRGAVVNTDDLVVALQEGILRGAALDVTHPEPLPAVHPLCHMDNCMVIPHLGSATVECRTAMARQAAMNLVEAL